MVDTKKCIFKDLKEDGANIKVTSENVKEYLAALSRTLLVDRYQELI